MVAADVGRGRLLAGIGFDSLLCPELVDIRTEMDLRDGEAQRRQNMVGRWTDH